MFEVILTPIDVNQIDATEASLAIARDLAERHNAKIVLLNVVYEMPVYVAAQLPRSVQEQALSDAKSTLTKMSGDNKLPPDTDILVREGHPSRTILEVAKETGTSIIVITSHDPGIADYLLGSVASHVVRHAHCSVLVVRNPAA